MMGMSFMIALWRMMAGLEPLHQAGKGVLGRP